MTAEDTSGATPNNRLAWKESHDAELRVLVGHGIEDSEIAFRMGRTLSAVQNRRSNLGLVGRAPLPEAAAEPGPAIDLTTAGLEAAIRPALAKVEEEKASVKAVLALANARYDELLGEERRFAAVLAALGVGDRRETPDASRECGCHGDEVADTWFPCPRHAAAEARLEERSASGFVSVLT